MAAKEVDEFAKLLVQHVRDEAIKSCDMLRNPECDSVDAKRLRANMESGNMDRLLEEVIADCVDDTLFFLLHAVDEGLLKISFKASSGKLVDLFEAGSSVHPGLSWVW
jgi:hypothetical protein